MSSPVWWIGDPEIEIPIFPLPQTVQLPGAMLPLHVFEPRYRALIRDAIQGDGRFAVALLKPGYETDYYGTPPVYPITCAGRLAAHEEMPDGRFYIVLEGLGRIELLDQVNVAPYRRYRARCLPDLLPDETGLLELETRSLVSCVHQVIQRIVSRRGTNADDEKTNEKLSSIGKQANTLADEPGRLADFLTACFVSEPAVRQSLLETFDVRERVRQVTGLLGDTLLRVEGAPRASEGLN